VSEIKELSVDLDSPIVDSSLERVLTPVELDKVKEEQKRRGKMSGPNNSVMNT
jgi:hypothetical protein